MSRSRLIFERQAAHAVGLAALLLSLGFAETRIEALRTGEIWGLATPFWLWAAVGVAVVHQVFVWFCWRMQLHAFALTRWFGARAFDVYAVVFAILGLTRVFTVFVLGYSNRGTVPLDATVLKVLALIALVPAAYLFYSVHRYFSFRRAFGIDHFDERYRSMPLVRSGIFRFTRNGMYIFGFLILWVAGLWFASAAALAAALFNHIYIWIHYYSTELPDMKRIYGEERISVSVGARH